jgi:hypothetical protein
MHWVGRKGTTVSRLPIGYSPKRKIYFKGYGDNNLEILFTINPKGHIILNSSGGAIDNVNAHVVFIASEDEL